MEPQISLKEAERRVFKTKTNDGLWDVFLGCYFLMFVLGPYMSTRLGDFWSSAIFLPFWGLVYLAILMIRRKVIKPRSGEVRYGAVRKAKLVRFTIVMLAVNILALILGIFAFVYFGRVPGQMMGIGLGLILLFGFSLAAYLLDYPRLYMYGLLVGLAPMVGEWLFVHQLASHHGFPVTFGLASGVMILTGLVVFARFLYLNPVPNTEKIASETNHA